jgi:PAS domain S-box-containing protein
MYSILYVDDEEMLLEIGKIFLEETGDFTVDTVASGQEALELLKRKHYDAVVSDYQMPGMDGLQLLTAIRESHITIPFIIFTGKGREDVVIDAFEKGADFYLQKGGDPTPQFAELSHKIKVIVGKRHAEADILVLNRLYSMLSSTNRAIVYIHDRHELLAEICRIIVEIGGFSMAWAGIVNPATRLIEPVAMHGPSDGYLDRIAISADDGPRGRGPSSTAFRSGEYNVCNNIATDERMKPVRNPALARGFGAIAAFPFAPGTGNAGVITIYAPRPGFFDSRILCLLEEMTLDVTFAMGAIEEERRRAEAERQVLQAKKDWEHIFQAIGNPTIIMDASYTVTEANAAVLQFTGKSPDQVKGRKCWEIFHEPGTSCPVEGCPFETVKRTGSKKTVDTEISMTGGVFIVAVTPLFDEQGHLDKVIHIATDITDRKKMETALRESEADLARAQKVASIGSWSYNLATKEVHWSDQMFEIFDLPLTTPVTYELWRSMIDPHDRERIRIIISEAFRKPVDHFDIGYRIIRPDGVVKDIYLLAEIGQAPNGKDVLVFGTLQDVTERMQAEKALKDSEERYRNVVETQTEFIARFLPDGTHIFVNQAYCRFFGYTCDQMMNRHFKPDVPPEDGLRIKNHLASLTPEHPAGTIEHRIILPGGSVRWVSWTDRAIFNSGGELVEYQSVGRDITGQK